MIETAGDIHSAIHQHHIVDSSVSCGRRVEGCGQAGRYAYRSHTMAGHAAQHIELSANVDRAAADDDLFYFIAGSWVPRSGQGGSRIYGGYIGPRCAGHLVKIATYI